MCLSAAPLPATDVLSLLSAVGDASDPTDMVDELPNLGDSFRSSLSRVPVGLVSTATAPSTGSLSASLLLTVVVCVRTGDAHCSSTTICVVAFDWSVLTDMYCLLGDCASGGVALGGEWRFGERESSVGNGGGGRSSERER